MFEQGQRFGKGEVGFHCWETPPHSPWFEREVIVMAVRLRDETKISSIMADYGREFKQIRFDRILVLKIMFSWGHPKSTWTLFKRKFSQLTKILDLTYKLTQQQISTDPATTAEFAKMTMNIIEK